MTRLPSLACAIMLFACGGPAVGPRTGPDDPIVAPAERWTWVDFPETFCGDGSPTGLGVNLTGRSDDVVVYFQGGGARYFAVPSTAHGLLGDLGRTSGGVTLSAWLARWYAGDPAWDSVGP